MIFKELFEKSHFCRAHCWKRFSELCCALQTKLQSTAVGQEHCAPRPWGAHATLAWGKKWLQPWNLERATQSSGMCSSTPSLLLFLPSCSESRIVNVWEVMLHLLSRPWDLSALSSEAVMGFHLPVPLCLDKRTAQPCAVSVCYALVGNPSYSVILVFHRLINVLNWIS